MATLIRFLIGLAGGLVAGIGVELLFVEVSDTSAPHHDSARIIQATPASQPASSQPAGIRSPSSNIHRAPPQAEFRRVIADATSQPYAALDRAAALGEPLRTLAFGQLAHEWVEIDRIAAFYAGERTAGGSAFRRHVVRSWAIVDAAELLRFLDSIQVDAETAEGLLMAGAVIRSPHHADTLLRIARRQPPGWPHAVLRSLIAP